MAAIVVCIHPDRDEVTDLGSDGAINHVNGPGEPGRCQVGGIRDDPHSSGRLRHHVIPMISARTILRLYTMSRKTNVFPDRCRIGWCTVSQSSAGPP